MTNTTINSNGNTQRKQLSHQLNRLDQILDGLAEALNESVADAVKDVIGQVVSKAVHAAVKEVLSSAELLKAAMEKHTPPASQPMPKRRTLKDLLTSAGNFMSEKVKQAVKKVRLAGSWCRQKLQNASAAVCDSIKRVPACCVKMCSQMASLGLGMWRFRKTCTIALAVGVLSALATYHAGPLVASVASGVSGAALTVSGMILLPLWRLISGTDKA